MVPRQEDDDEDDISLTSTVQSEPKSEYEVEQVLAEQRFENGVRYLVQWAGYPPERNSWEPADAFSGGQTILGWRRKKRDILAGKCKSFDVDAWLQYMEDFEEKREDRKRRREAKRRRLGALAAHDQRRASDGTSKVAQKTDSQRPLQKPLSRRHSSGPGVQAQRRVPQEVPPLLFGGGKPPQAHPQRRSSLHVSTSMNSGKLLVRILYGPDRRMIGAARLCGLESRIRAQLLRHKGGHSLDIWFQHVCTLDQYQTIAPNAMGRAYDVGWIEGYDDTTPDIRLMSQDLKQENTVAIYNFERVGLAFLAYPPDSLDFRDLSNVRKDIPDVYLHIHVRESLNSIEQLHTNTHVQNSTPRYPETAIAGSAENVNRSDHLSSTEGYEETRREFTRSMKVADRTVIENASKRHMSPDQHVAEATVNGSSLPNLLEDINTDPFLPELAAFEAMDFDHEGPPPALQQKKSLTDDELNLKTIFKKQFKVNFETLVKVNAGSKTQLAKALYLMYPEDPIHAEEFQLLAEFLKYYNPVIYSSQYEGDWEKFARTVSTGVVFFHESFAAFHTLPFLKQLLGKSSVGFWSVSLVKPLQFADHPSHFQRIFPHGCVILMTEEFMVREQHGTIVLLAWMNDWMRKKIPGYWKMMFRPDILNWVLQQHETSPQADQENWLTMYRLISQLCVPSAYDTASGEVLSGSTDEYFESNAISPPELQGYGSRTEKDIPDIPAGLSRAHLNADHLIEFFAGWALVNNHLYRRFVVVTSPGLRLPRWAEWNHIELKHGAREFIESFKIDYRYYWSKLTEKPGSQGGAKDHHSHQAASPYTPRTPRGLRAAPTEHKASKLTQTMNSASAQYNYPEPYH
ncbi:hypothetical protein ASPACDRAFT_25704 [Aspergillus aculeatus ATCC 16872]|uniref:Chromo domain-containing protein n=1 Tax=Aspergillus aculeatus (strain ATCC 16872 / CBS 172.66 / WB 5094) TaxID=690307 RepID=A0A1L9WYH5_ASPA1|nr:uncharacterized protein ASPACDRAFT_25704 [Aspergillus aculeatus ATCC 16872]OJK01169.1 hypothetical protein ASPACDRAFT_25704 [Aspergillus aculeatus ATCC 16872]